MKIYTIGGFNEVGKNMTAVDLGEDVILFDCGLFLPPIVELEEAEKVYTEKKLRGIKAIPDDLMLDKLGLRDKVRAIIPSHAHLDHIGAIPFMAHRYNAEVIGTPFTIEVLKSILSDEKINLMNKLKVVQPNSFCYVQGKQKKYRVDFVNITHSTIQCSLVALHTPEGIVLYANDFKLDNTPIMGQKPNYDLLKKLGEEGIKVLIVDSLYSGDARKTASEKVARTLLEEVLFTTRNENAGLIVTTFSSHIARLKSITEFGKKLNRKIVFLGRSLNKYVTSATKVDMCPFRKDVEIATYRKQLERKLKQIDKRRSEYMVVCTGHQGEPGSILDRLGRNKLPFKFNKEDNIVFSSSIIPAETNIKNRERLDLKLRKRGARLFNNVHVSGHGGREDLRDFLNLINPEHIIPSHGSHEKIAPMIDLAKELGYKPKNLHLMNDGDAKKF
ncbi:RNase J family beta-CASP ribonuclease [archaeon]|jgi:ribonuclease J|nr:RNase J family beta-CASP ribonuclease [Candidatus Woesearchaeota archaeon]MBT4136133.1 RNase J family beta-CASP ribonuclease [archaeon]MBT4242264.1 RNase J family beta-CASP ribonuclease [archaeon]MBT4417952.1 RNase J family beta-CASP ribonuclease [archaeon]